VTGGAGFIGHHLVEKLSERDCEITVIDNLSNANGNFLRKVKDALRSQNVSRSHFLRLHHLLDNKNNNNKNKNRTDSEVSLYIDDVRDKDALIEIFKREETDTCFHLASKISVPESIRNPGETIDVNIKGTFNVLEACSAADTKNLLFASSSAVYGEPKALPISEEHSLDPMSPYGASKIAGEALISSFRNTGKIQNGISLRMFNVFGEGQSSEYAGVITKFAERLSSGLQPIIYGDGNQTRDFIFIDDVVDAMLLAAQQDQNERKKTSPVSSVKVRAFNVGTGKVTKIKDLAVMMTKIFNLDLEPIFAQNREGDIINSRADITKLETDLGYLPTHDVELSLNRLFPSRQASSGLN
jgi:UDP-glucose 4-epimerase